MSKEYLGRGVEHITYKTKIGNRDYVLKKPRAYNAWTLRHMFGGTDTLRHELKNSIALAAKSDVVVPKTRIIPFKRGYVMGQEFIENDKSVPSIRRAIQETDNSALLLHYETRPQNFLSHDHTIYWIDPTRAPFFRLTDKLPVISEQGIRKGYRALRRIFRKIK